MKLLHTCYLLTYALITAAHTHECFAAPDDWHKHLCAGAYLALTIAQGVFVYLLYREGKNRREPAGR
jgi:hypothetical protein